jgi:hypothetical protein
MSGQSSSSFPTPWQVRADPGGSPLRVRVPATRGDGLPSEFLRLDVRRSGILGKLVPRPVLRAYVAAGSTDRYLTVSKTLKLAIGTDPIDVKEASERAYRWYRLSRSSGSLFSAVGAIIGALLVALGALGPESTTGKGLVIAGVVLTVIAGAGMVISAWWEPVE